MTDKPEAVPQLQDWALPPHSIIGIVGGGQLGRMDAMAAARLGYRCHILTPEEDSPASHVCAQTFLGDYEDPELLRAFAESVDVVTFEFENVSAEGLDLLQSIRPVRPSPKVLRISQDRKTEKTFLKEAGVKTASFVALNSRADLHAAVARIGLPGVLKTARGGYDGKGQLILRSVGELNRVWEELNPKPLIMEGFVKFEREISVIVARGLDGAAVAFDPVENRHRNGILNVTIAPANIPEQVAADATAIALHIAEALELIGLLAVEMFVTPDGAVLVNEIAPRPHNSGHWTIDGCPVSQFEMHIRAVAGLPLLPAVRHSDAVMKNLIGPDEVAQWPAILATPGVMPHLYGKAEARPGRKMGHVTTLHPLGTLHKPPPPPPPPFWERPFPEQATAEDIYSCFRLILGRNPQKSEWEGHSANIGQALTSVVSNYVRSLEFDRRKLRAVASGGAHLAEMDGWRIYADPSDHAVGQHVLQGTYEPEVAAIFHQVLAPGMGVVDIGANIGYFSLLSAQLTGPTGLVFAVEPNSANVRMIEASRRLNGFAQITICQAAAAERMGIKVLNSFHSNGTTADAPDDESLFDVQTVSCVMLDNVLPDRPFHLVKIDVEGAEYTALRGCEQTLRKWRPLLVSEFSPDMMTGISGVTGTDYLGWLISLGYHIAVLRKDAPPLQCGTSIDDVMGAYKQSGIDHIDLLASPS